MSDGFKMIAARGATLKRQQLEREIWSLPPGPERTNIIHTYNELFMFLELDIREAMKGAARPCRDRQSLRIS